MIVYKVVNKSTGKAYVGQTCRTLGERMKEHVQSGRLPFDDVLRELGPESFEISVIDEAETAEELNEKERFWIDRLGTLYPNGYNVRPGGGNRSGWHHTEASKEKMRAMKSGKGTGRDNPFYGKHHSEETKKKFSERRKGLAHMSPEGIERFAAGRMHLKGCVNLDTGERFESIKEAAERYGITPTHISRVCRGKRKKTGGFRWAYA